MRKIREVLRLRVAGRGQRVIAQSVGVGQSTVSDCLIRAHRAGISWPVDLDDAALENALYPPAPVLPSARRGIPDWATVHQELIRDAAWSCIQIGYDRCANQCMSQTNSFLEKI